MIKVLASALLSIIISCNGPDNNASFIGSWELTNFPSGYPGPVKAKLSLFADSTATSKVMGKDTVFFFDKGHYRYFKENKTLVFDWENHGELSLDVKKLDAKRLHLYNRAAKDIEKYVRVEK